MDSIQSVLDRLEQGDVPVHRIHVKDGQTFTLKVKELLACCAKNPDHPHATVFRNAVAAHLPSDEVHVDRVDLEALLENKTVEIVSEQNVEIIDGGPKTVVTERKTKK